MFGVFHEHNLFCDLTGFFHTVMDNDVFNNLDLQKELPAEKFDIDLVLEGGAIDVNGQGMCLTTEQTLLHPNRNGAKNKSDIEKYLGDYLDVEKTIWLKEGLTNDHTDGHIDEIARFVGTNKIVCAYEDNVEDENFKILDDNYQVLKNTTDQNGKSFEIIKLPMPHMLYDDGVKAPVSYCNFYIGNEHIVPDNVLYGSVKDIFSFSYNIFFFFYRKFRIFIPDSFPDFNNRLFFDLSMTQFPRSLNFFFSNR